MNCRVRVGVRAILRVIRFQKNNSSTPSPPSSNYFPPIQQALFLFFNLISKIRRKKESNRHPPPILPHLHSSCVSESLPFSSHCSNALIIISHHFLLSLSQTMTRSFVPNFGLKDFLFHLQSGHIRAVNVEWVLNIPLHPMRRKILVNASPAPPLLLPLLPSSSFCARESSFFFFMPAAHSLSRWIPIPSLSLTSPLLLQFAYYHGWQWRHWASGNQGDDHAHPPLPRLSPLSLLLLLVLLQCGLT